MSWYPLMLESERIRCSSLCGERGGAEQGQTRQGQSVCGAAGLCPGMTQPAAGSGQVVPAATNLPLGLEISA